MEAQRIADEAMQAAPARYGGPPPLPPPPAAPLRALGDAAGADGTEYYICITVTPAHVLGERVDHSLFRTTFLAGRNYGVCEKDGEPPFMVAKNSELTAEGLKSEMWVQGYGRASGGGGATTPPPSAAGGASASEDARTLAIKRTRIGDRYRALKDCRRQRGGRVQGLPLEGPRTSGWLLREISKTGQDPSSRHVTWKHENDIKDDQKIAEVHEALSEVLDLAVTYDQLDCSNLAL